MRTKRDDDRQFTPAKTMPAAAASRFERQPADDLRTPDKSRRRGRLKTAHDFFLLKNASRAARMPPPIATATFGACEDFGF
jgi:hypothetical protein